MEDAGLTGERIFLIGNKEDLEEKRAVKYGQGDQYAKSHGMTFFEVSSCTGHNIIPLKREIFEKYYTIPQQPKVEDVAPEVHLEENNKTNHKKCNC